MLNRRVLLSGFPALALAGFSAARASGSTTTLVRQPSYTDGIASHFSVSGVVPPYTPTDVFYLHANQASPFTSNGNFVPVSWDAASKTGLVCPPARRLWQRGIWVPPSVPNGGTAVGHSAAQIYGGGVGAYLNSADLIDGSPYNRMMIAPTFTFGTPSSPFASSTAELMVLLDLQVPTATDFHAGNLSNTYIRYDLLFTCQQTGGRLSLSCQLFANNEYPTEDSANFDVGTSSVIIAPLVSPLGKLVTLQAGSAVYQPLPWSGWKTFAFSMSQSQFASALKKAQPVARQHHVTLNTNPADYVLSATHLNAELHYSKKMPATLGWSMRNLTLTLTV